VTGKLLAFVESCSIIIFPSLRRRMASYA